MFLFLMCHVLTLLQATLHGSIGGALDASTRQQCCSAVDGVATWHPATVILGARRVLAYGVAGIAALGYVAVLVDCDVSLLGLLYLLLLAVLLLCQPARGSWQGSSAPSGGRAGVGGGSGVLLAVMQGDARRVGESVGAVSGLRMR